MSNKFKGFYNVHSRHQIYDLDRDAETILNQVQHKVHDILGFFNRLSDPLTPGKMTRQGDEEVRG